MKKLIKIQHAIFTLILLFTLSVSAQSNKTIKGNGKISSKTIKTGDYDGIACAGSMDYILVNGTEGNITVEGEENLLDYIVAEVKDNTLKVKVKKNFNLKPSKNKTIKITIPFKDISSVALAGSGDLWNEDNISTNHLEVALAGSGDLTLDIETSEVEGKIAGSGDLTLKGSTNNLIAKVAGSGDFHGFHLQANNTDVAVAGSGDAEVVSNQSIKARVAGSGDIAYKGNPEKEDNKVSGSGDISKS
ncbi:head GIN domain-containing protein [Yeosuana sp. MJ-SS3]|uniref:Head GIN domain-containing protein n=1 Tax=Gilvirhabdus luticola TaxID=3079858 RepID=A0ABU3UA20_9FLAO|nr:head GIN domain-containing protein [Yeosuana sp. MJ-SS3]MDU8887259.1 head GIN domain-containing protein [Yeosuana sp. MJ-SS3]